MTYDLAQYEIANKKQRVTIYPLLGSFHHYLPKGEYYLYFVYAFNPKPRFILKDIPIIDHRIFKGNFISNKVKLIVE